MTKKCVFTLFLCLVVVTITAQNPGGGTSISLTAEYVGTGSQVPSAPKTPIMTPKVSIDGNVLYFGCSHADFVLTLTDEDGNVMYVANVASSDTQLTLPSSLSGTFELRLYAGIYCFVGEITL